MASKFDPVFLERTRQEYNRLYATKPREASAYLKQLCETSGLVYKTLHKHLKLGKRCREMSIGAQVRQAELNSWARLVWDHAQANSYDLNKITVQVAFDDLCAKGRIPEGITIKQIYEAMRRQNLRNDSQTVWKRIEWKQPMSVWQMDFSVSRYFKHLSGKGRDGSAGEIMCVKPVTTKRQDDGVKLQFGVAVDASTRVIYVKYFLAPGESAQVVIDFALDAFEAKPGTFALQGLPKCVYLDNGPGWTDERTKNGLTKLLHAKPIFGGFEKDALGNEKRKRNKQGRGVAERTVQVVKDKLEASLYLKFGEGRRLSVFELNEAVMAWIEEWNQGPHPMDRDESKINMLLAVAGHQFEQLRFPPEDARALFSRSYMLTCIRRKFNLGKQQFAIAPSFADDGKEYEIVRDQTGVYLFLDDQMHKLVVEGEAKPATAKTIGATGASRVIAERKDVKLSELPLRKRFHEECMKQLDAAPDDDQWEDSKPFLSEPRTGAEIEEHVSWLKMMRSARTKPVVAAPVASAPAPKQLPVIPNNIIKLPLDSYVGPRQR